MVKISELETDVSIGGAEQLVVNDGGTTKKTTVDAILARQHNHTVSDITDFDTAVDAKIDVPNDTAKTTPVDTDVFALWDTIRKKVTWANIKDTLKTFFDTLYHTKNALRTGLTANQILTTDSSGVEGYSALSLLPVVASDAEVITGTNEAKYTNSKQLRVNSRTVAGNTQRYSFDSTGTQNIAHGLGQTPRLVELYYAERDSPASATCMGTYDGTTNQTLGIVDIGSTAEMRLDSTKILIHQDSTGAGRTATATFDATNIVLSWTKTGSGQNIDVIWKAHA